MRTRALWWILLAILAPCCSRPASSPATPGQPIAHEHPTRVLVGSGFWGEPSGGAVTLYDVSEGAGEVGQARLMSRVAAGGLLSYVIAAPDGHTYYAADEETGALLRVRLDGDRLTLINRTPTSGHPVYLNLAERHGRRFLLTASYAEGIVESYALGANGDVGHRAGVEKTGAHAHSIVLAPDIEASTLLVANEGADTITVLSLRDDGSFQRLADVPSAAGPRHLAFHGDMLYVTHEQSVTVGWLRWNSTTRTLTPIGVTPPLAHPMNAEGKVTAAHLLVEGSELFVTVRAGSESEVLGFRLDAHGDGAPVLTSRTRTLGATPRHFMSLPRADSEVRLLVGNQDGRSLAFVTPGSTTRVVAIDVRPFFVLAVR